MTTLGRLSMYFLILGMLLTACSPAASVATPIPSPPLPQPVLPQATFIPNSEVAGVGVPAFKFLYNKSELVVISPATGQQLDAFTPIPFQGIYSYAFAPDGHELALVADTSLYLIDLPSWKSREYNLGVQEWISSIVYRPDGSLLALASGDPESNIWVIDPGSGEILAHQKADFSIRKTQFTVDGKSLMAYGPHIASNGVAANAGVSAGPPKAAIYSVSDLSLIWSSELDGIRDGIFPKKETTTITQDIYAPGAAWYYEPGTVFSPVSDMLYLVHGDEEKLTTVDFTQQKVQTVDVHAKTSWLDQILVLTAGVAYAKGTDGTTKQAFISPDGKFLFVGGYTEAVTQQADGSDLKITDTPLGLQVITVEDGRLVTDMHDAGTLTGLSSDGRYLFLTVWKDNDWSGVPTTDVYDTSSLSLVKHIEHVQLMPTHRIDGKPILVSTKYIGTNGDDVCFLVTMDPDTWTITNRWNGSCVDWLISP